MHPGLAFQSPVIIKTSHPSRTCFSRSRMSLSPKYSKCRKLSSGLMMAIWGVTAGDPFRHVAGLLYVFRLPAVGVGHVGHHRQTVRDALEHHVGAVVCFSLFHFLTSPVSGSTPWGTSSGLSGSLSMVSGVSSSSRVPSTMFRMTSWSAGEASR